MQIKYAGQLEIIYRLQTIISSSRNVPLCKHKRAEEVCTEARNTIKTENWITCILES